MGAINPDVDDFLVCLPVLGLMRNALLNLIQVNAPSMSTNLYGKKVKAAVAALWNTRGLSWPSSFEQQRQKAGELDLLDWLRAMFGFQACTINLDNWSELLRVTLDDRAVDALMSKLFKNYKTWCKFLGRKRSEEKRLWNAKLC
ncbi:Callose synthase 5 [Sarracenia purpurea var. burkii]